MMIQDPTIHLSPINVSIIRTLLGARKPYYQASVDFKNTIFKASWPQKHHFRGVSKAAITPKLRPLSHGG